jgi:NTP pyrophosphatase (non-canonical NTP hydrolase)
MSQRLNFLMLRGANVRRLPLFQDANGRPAHARRDGSDWSPADWMTALTGEVGEAANIIKKVRRGDFPLNDAREILGDELADIMIYLDLLAFQCGIDLEEAVIRKFNKVSDKQGIKIRL